MAQKNSFRNSSSNDQFDLDDYIEQNSHSDTTPKQEQPIEKSSSSWLKNTMLLVVFGLITLLYFNNWSPSQVYGNIFGVPEYQDGFNTVIETPDGTIVIDNLNNAGIAQLEALERLENLEGLEVLENLESLEQLENLEVFESLESLEALEAFENLQNFENEDQLRQFALQTAMQALEGIGSSEDFGRLIGETAQLEIQQALLELEQLNQTEGNSPLQKSIDSNFDQYNESFANAGFSTSLSSNDIQKLYNGNVPVSFLQDLDNLNLLDKLSVDSIIEAYNPED